jgi:hypothetical protein
VTTKPRRRASAAAAPHSRLPAPPVPPLWVRRLAQASCLTDPIRAVERRHQGSPPWPPGRPRWRWALKEPPTWQSPPLWLPPQPPPPDATQWPRPHRAGGSLAAAALSAALVTLDECRLMGTDVPNLNTLAGARSGTIDAALSTRRQEFELQPFEPEHLEERLLTSRWKSPAFTSSRAQWAQWWRPASPLPCSQTPPRLVRGASAARTASSVDRLRAGASAPTPRRLTLCRLHGSW